MPYLNNFKGIALFVDGDMICRTDIAETVTEQQDKATKWQRVATGDISENGRGGFFRTAAQIDGQNNPVRVIEDYSLIAVRN